MKNNSLRFAIEAEERRCVLFGPPVNGDKNYRHYIMPCSKHTRDVSIPAMRRGQFCCVDCKENNLKKDAEQIGAKIVGKSKKGHNYVNCILECGHKKTCTISSIRAKTVACKICAEQAYIKDAEKHGIVYLGKSAKGSRYRDYRLSCGHKKSLVMAKVKIGSFRCSCCIKEKHEREAKKRGCKILGAGATKSSMLYELDCGHRKNVAIASIRNGNYICQDCNETSRTMPSSVYLIQIECDGESWLKLGYAKSIEGRTSRYKLPHSAIMRLVHSVGFDTGNKAHEVEAAIHHKHRSNRLSRKRSIELGMKSGFDECYPTHMLTTLIDELKSRN